MKLILQSIKSMITKIRTDVNRLMLTVDNKQDSEIIIKAVENIDVGRYKIDHSYEEIMDYIKLGKNVVFEFDSTNKIAYSELWWDDINSVFVIKFAKHCLVRSSDIIEESYLVFPKTSEIVEKVVRFSPRTFYADYITLNSSTVDSTKCFRIDVDDNGTINVKEIV